MRLRSRIIALSALLATAPVLLVGAFAAREARLALDDEVELRLGSANDQRRGEIRRWLDGATSLLAAIAERPELVSQLAQLGPEGQVPESLRAAIRERHLNFWTRGTGTELQLLAAASGRVEVSTDPQSEGRSYRDEAYFVRGRVAASIGAAAYDPRRHSAEVFVSSPVRDLAGRSLAVLAGRLDWSDLAAMLARGTQADGDEETYLVARDYTALTPTRHAGELPVVSVGVRSCLAGANGVARYANYAGEPVIGAYLWLPRLQACLVTEQLAAAAHAPLRALTTAILLGAAFIAVLAGLAGAAFASHLLRPLQLLRARVEAVSRGNLATRVGTVGADEIGEVAGAFDRMMDRLQAITASRDELDREVSLRGVVERELIDANARSRALFDCSPDCLFLLAADDLRVLDCNQGACRLLGYSREALLALSIHDLDKASTPYQIHQRAETLLRDGRIDFETALTGAGGEAVPVLVTVQLIELQGRKCFHAVQRDIRQLKAADLALRRSEQRFRRAVTDAPFPAMIHAAGGEILISSDAWHALTGHPRGSRLEVAQWVTGAQAILAPDKAAWLTARYDIAERRDEGLVAVRTANDGERVWQAVSVPLGELADGRPVVMSAAADITGLKQAQRRLAARNRELRRSNRDLEQFAYVASHDLQEPLRMVAGFTEMLSRRYAGRLDADADRYIGFAIDGAHRMQRLIQDLLAFSRVSTRGKPFEPVDTAALLDEVRQNLGLAIAEAGATLELGPLPVVLADRVQLGLVFQNLLANSLKFRGEAPPVIRIGCTDLDDAWEFSVADNGIGLDPQYAERIFVIFQRLQSREQYPGTGIGLAIVKRIVERHGGRVRVESSPGRGATFSFTIARQPPAEEPVDATDESDAPPAT